MAKTMAFSLPPNTKGVDMFYHQLTKILAISAAQLVECACWRRSYSTPSPVQIRSS
jgi:hypothetical protein